MNAGVTAVSPGVGRQVEARRLVVSVAAAAALNLVVFAIGSVAGLDWQANGQSINAIMVVAATLVPMAVGAGLTLLLARRWPAAPRVMAWLGLALALISVVMPFAAGSGAATAVALASMHVITGVAWFAGIHPRRTDAV